MANILNRLLGIDKLVQSQIKAGMQAAVTWRPATPIYPDWSQENGVQKGYCTNADLYSIISRKAQMAAGIPFYVYRVKGKEGKKLLRQYKQLTSGDAITAKSLAWANVIKTKALEDVEEDHPLNKLLLRPNNQCSPSEFFENAYGFLDITGNAYIGKLRLDAGANAGKVQSLYNLPSPYIEILPDGLFPLGVAGYVMILWGQEPIEQENVIHLKYFNPDYQANGSHLYGMSPLRAANKVLERSNSAVDSQVAQFQNGGPAGFVFNETVPVDERNQQQMGILKKRFYTETGGDRNRGKIFFSAGKIGYVSTGLSPVDLKILESEMYTFRQLCRVYKMPSAIFNDNEHATLNNMEQFYKAAYTDGVIPMVTKMRDALNMFLLPDFSQDGELFIDADYSNIPVLQEDFKTMTDWLKDSWEITPNERRELKKFGRLEDPNMDKVWMPTNLDTMDNMGLTMDDPGAGQQPNEDDLDNEGLNPYKTPTE